MDASAADLLRTVEYSRDRWTVERVPFALLFCLVGVVFVIHVDPQPPGRGIVLGLITLATLVLGFLAKAFLLELIFEGPRGGAGLLVAFMAVVCLTEMSWSAPAQGVAYAGSNVPEFVFGWMAIIASVSWITFAFYRHFYPGKPMLVLSPAGLTYHSALLKDLFIPWPEVQGIDEFEIARAPGPPQRVANITAVTVSREFYERHILVQRSILRGPRRSWEGLLQPKGASMQVALHLLAIDPGDIREPVEARWKAFRNGPPPADAMPVGQAPDVYGRWKIDGSIWQAVRFLGPLTAIILALVYAPQLWQR